MVLPESDTYPMDWDRKPLSEGEEALASDAFSKVLAFYQTMGEAVVKRYASKAARENLRRMLAPIVLNAFDGYLAGRPILIERNDEATAFAERLGVSLDALRSPAVALAQVGFLDLTSQDQDLKISMNDSHGDGLSELKATVLDYSQLLDVHTWSEHSEVNAFVDSIYETHFGTGYASIQKKHIKVLLLDLYVRWSIDPALKTAFHRNANSYEPGSRYNAIHISKLMRDIVDRLEQVGLIRRALGYYPHDGSTGRVTRIWPTGKFIRMFEDAKFGPLDIGDHPKKELIVLRQTDPKNPKKQIDIEYEDTGRTKGMGVLLKAYNKLLQRTFIDIPFLENSFIELSPEKDGKRRRLHITQQDKTVRRIFNRGSFEKGGRFWGGWWQRCPKEWRDKIYIADGPTIEIDYSGHHLVMLYANAGIDYWKAVGTDPYTLELPDFEGTESELRQLCKELTLIALNAKNDTATFSAFRDEADTGSLQKRMTNKELGQILSALREKHKPIAHKFASDAGIDLMSQDARIAERVINHFTRQGIPVLCIHDSFIAPLTLGGELQRVMLDAFQKVTGAEQAKMDTVAKGIRYFPLKDSPPLKARKPRRSKSDPIIIIEPAKGIIPRITERYVHNRERFNEWRQKSTRMEEHQRGGSGVTKCSCQPNFSVAQRSEFTVKDSAQ